MTQLDDLDDDCLLEVLDRLAPEELFKLQRLNQRMKRLANIKMGVKIKVIRFWNEDRRDISNCHHLGFISRNQVLILGSVFKEQARDYLTPPKYFLSLLDNCAGVKSIGFAATSVRLPEGLLLEVIKRCPEVECLKLGYSLVGDEEWVQVLNQIGHQLVHFAKKCHFNVHSIDLLKTVAAKCPNIKRLDWFIIGMIAADSLFSVFKTLPKSCWVTLRCDRIHGFEDLVDHLDVQTLNLSALGRRVDRLSSLKICRVDNDSVGVNFVGLRKLNAINVRYVNGVEELNSFLAANRFPCLESIDRPR